MDNSKTPKWNLNFGSELYIYSLFEIYALLAAYRLSTVRFSFSPGVCVSVCLSAFMCAVCAQVLCWYKLRDDRLRTHSRHDGTIEQEQLHCVFDFVIRRSRCRVCCIDFVFTTSTLILHMLARNIRKKNNHRNRLSNHSHHIHI